MEHLFQIKNLNNNIIMKENNFSRRDFFKKAIKVTLPILGAVLLPSVDIIASKTTAKTIANPFKQYTKIGKSFLCSENADAQALPNDNKITIIKQSALLFPTASTCDASGSFNKSYTNHALDSIKESIREMKYIPTNAIMKIIAIKISQYSWG